ncbi:MAG: M28 family peptidase [Ignavibacteriae bacterium]|nr:M28 family peptidase [Ignavibacteriota bacterium]
MKTQIKINSFLIFFISAQLIFSQKEIVNTNSYTYVKSNLEFLASDELEGREFGSRGEKLASLFISEELEKYGVKPFGDNGTYFQNFNIVVESFEEGANLAFQFEDSSKIIYENGTDIIFFSRSLPSEKSANKIFNIVFVGYGIESEEDNYNSYKDVDVNGKVILYLVGTPKKDGKEILSESSVRKFKRSNAKSKIAKEKGAVAMISIADDELLSYWEFIRQMGKSKNFFLEQEIISEDQKDIPSLVLNENAAKSILVNEKYNFEFLKNNLENPITFELNAKVKLNYKVSSETKIARNVIGIIEGNNPKLQNEFVAIGAHYDHEGIKGNQVYNGADDNGSGTVTILETARKLAQSKNNERPVLIIFHTGEEKGLKGAEYLTSHNNFIDKIISYINIDMVGRESEDSIYCIGASKLSKELGNLVEEANENSSKFYLNYKFDDPNDPNRFYYRSDHIHYAEKGIPIAFFYDYMNEDYHKPTDDVEKINFVKIVKMVNLLENLTNRISNLDHKFKID